MLISLRRNALMLHWQSWESWATSQKPRTRKLLDKREASSKANGKLIIKRTIWTDLVHTTCAVTRLGIEAMDATPTSLLMPRFFWTCSPFKKPGIRRRGEANPSLPFSAERKLRIFGEKWSGCTKARLNLKTKRIANNFGGTKLPGRKHISAWETMERQPHFWKRPESLKGLMIGKSRQL